MNIIKEYNTTILTKDENNKEINVNLNLVAFDNLEWTADIYDSKGRHFCLKTKDNINDKYTHNFEHYYNKAIKNQLNIIYDYEEVLVYLDGGGFCDQANNLYECFNINDNLSLLEKQINELENEIDELKKIKDTIKNKYPLDNNIIFQNNFIIWAKNENDYEIQVEFEMIKYFNGEWIIQAYEDDTNRYFRVKSKDNPNKIDKKFEYYLDKAKNNSLNLIYIPICQEEVEIYLENEQGLFLSEYFPHLEK